MSINKKNLSYEEFLKNEIKTLKTISGFTQVANSFPDLRLQSERTLLQYANRKNYSKLGLNFGCQIELLIENKIMGVTLEALIEPGFSQSSYALNIYDQNKTPPLLIRKFHFDYAPNISKKSKQPIYHLQYGGKPTPKMTELQIDDSHIQNWLSSPRLFNTPVNLALFIDLVFCEFSSETTDKIIDSTEWRNLIKNNEDKIFKGYYERIKEFFSSSHKSNFLFRDFYYGK